jgi:hypothetical protein
MNAMCLDILHRDALSEAVASSGDEFDYLSTRGDDR